MPRSVAVIGAGQIGFAAAQVFGEAGWQVRVLSRSRPAWLNEVECEFTNWARGNPTPATDVTLDTIAYDAADLSDHRSDAIGRLVVVSSASVYCDAKGRTLDEATVNGFPQFADPITEEQATVAPGPQTYSTRKMRMEQAALALFGTRTVVLRPCAIHGPWSRHPREWWFVKRLLDERKVIPLALEGESRFQTTSAAAIAAFALHAAEHEVGGTFNIADGDTPTAWQIGAAVSDALEREAKFTPLPGFANDGIGKTPWSVPHPFIISAGKAVATGFAGPVPYKDAVVPAVDWLGKVAPHDWQSAFPQLAAYPWNLFDYAAEDAVLEKL